MAQNKDFIKQKYLVDLKSKKISIAQINDNQPFVLIFIAAECPISQKYAPILRGMQRHFGAVKFIAIFSKWDKREAMKEYLRDYPLSMAAFRDEKNRLVEHIQALITPEAFLFDEKGILQYRGAIDNWFYGLGKYRPDATEHYLADAIQLFLNNEPIKIKKTDAIGCIIEK